MLDERIDCHLHRPHHPARGLPPAARRRARELPARIGRAREARAALLHRLAARAWSASTKPRAAASRSSATSATTTPRCWSRRCRSRTPGPTSPRAASSSPRRWCASTTRRGWRRCSPAIRPSCALALHGALRSRGRQRRGVGLDPARSPSRHEYERAVVKAKEHIRAGDAFQIVLSQRAERPTSASALDLYRSLRRVNPSPYLFLLELDGLALVGSSPETLVKSEGRARVAEPDRRHDAARARATPSGCSPPRRTAPST